MLRIQKIFFSSLFLFTTSCAIMHHTQVGEVDSEVVLNGTRFELLVSETGFNIDEAAGIAKGFSRSAQGQQNIQAIQDAIGLFQMGPRTGNPVFNDTYADPIFEALKTKCPLSRISGLTSIRETAKYPVVSGEIIKIIGYCRKKS